jgi:sporulation protein YlmC with PRC-barrel domain
MIRLTQLIGQPTIALRDAEHTGHVKGVTLEGGRVVGVHNGDGVIDASSIHSFEGDAITYDGVPHLVSGDADSPVGRRVLDEDGDELGRLADLELEADGTVTLVVLDDGRSVSGGALRAVGSYAVIVAARPDTTPTTDATRTTLPPPPQGTTPT